MSIRSFARTGGRLTSAEAEALAAHGGEYLIGADPAGYVASLHPGSLDLTEIFPRRGPLVIEIGSGMGDQAVSYAAAHQDVNLLAVEVWRQGIAGTILRATAAGVANVRIIQADAATLFREALPSGCATEVWTFFPDPWPKARHHKRRLVTPEFAQGVARVLAPGGVWRLATDWEDYALQMRDVVAGAAAFIVDSPANDGFSPRWEGRVVTRYERRGQQAGRSIYDLTAVRR